MYIHRLKSHNIENYLPSLARLDLGIVRCGRVAREFVVQYQILYEKLSLTWCSRALTLVQLDQKKKILNLRFKKKKI